jgi:methionine-rich copper-binding protein CopC
MTAIRRIAAAVLAIVALLVATPAVSLAAEGLTSADPADRAVLMQPPAAVHVTFSGALDMDQSHVGVVDDTATSVTVGAFTATRPDTLRQTVSVPARGNVVVVYHVVFVDGAEATGTIQFSVGTGVPPPVAPDAAQRAATTPAHGHGIDPVNAALLCLDLVVLIGAVVLVKRRSRRPDHTR